MSPTNVRRVLSGVVTLCVCALVLGFLTHPGCQPSQEEIDAAWADAIEPLALEAAETYDAYMAQPEYRALVHAPPTEAEREGRGVFAALSETFAAGQEQLDQQLKRSVGIEPANDAAMEQARAAFLQSVRDGDVQWHLLNSNYWQTHRLLTTHSERDTVDGWGVDELPESGEYFRAAVASGDPLTVAATWSPLRAALERCLRADPLYDGELGDRALQVQLNNLEMLDDLIDQGVREHRSPH